METISNMKMKYVLLIIATIFLLFSINSFIGQVTDIGIKPFTNLSADRMTGQEEFILHVKKPASIHLLHNVKLDTGSIRFKLERNDGQVVTDYDINDDDFINKVIKLDEGTYYCTINRDVTKTKENFRLYFDKRYIDQEYIKNNSKTEHNS